MPLSEGVTTDHTINDASTKKVVLQCDQLEVSILSIRDTEEKVIWRDCTTM